MNHHVLVVIESLNLSSGEEPIIFSLSENYGTGDNKITMRGIDFDITYLLTEYNHESSIQQIIHHLFVLQNSDVH